MKEKRNCRIVQDLLPNYIEKLTNEETNSYIEEHLKECNECEKVLKNMQQELSINSSKRDSREVNYIKKYNKKFKLLRNILLLILLLFIIVIGRKTLILATISNKINKIKDTNNYYIKSESFFDGEMTIAETYKKDDKVLIKKRKYSRNNQITNNVIYKSGEECFMLTDNGKEKTLIKLSDVLIDTPSFNSNSLLENIKIAFTTTIRKSTIKGIECYVIREENNEKFIDVNTGLTIKMVSNDADATINYEYEYGIVHEEDIVRPDTTDYKATDF